jgi:prepilin-type N-terminal cleavage/methylation domain-containing protein
MKRIPNTHGTGFTLVELIMVIALLAILASVTIPRISWGLIGKAQAKTSAREFSDYLKLARSLAITHASTNSSGYKVLLSGSLTTYSLIDAATLQTIKEPVDIPQSVICSGDDEFHFTPLGQLQGGGTLTVHFTNAGDTKVVTASAIGRITVE